MLCLLLAAVFSCSCAVQLRTEYKQPLIDQGELYFYLQPLPQEMLALTFTISDLSALPKQGNAVPLMQGELRINGSDLVDKQKRLLRKTLPPGSYAGVSLTISQATIETEQGEVDLMVPEQPLRIELDFSILRANSHALFLILSPEYLLSEGFRFTPRFVLAKPHQLPKNYLGFISSTNDNLITVFNKRTMEVVQTIHAGVAPKGMALDQERGIVYVALAGEDAVARINVDSMDISGKIKLRFGDEPSELALGPDGRTLICANTGSGTVSIIDTGSMAEKERLSLEPDPAWVVTGRNDQRAYVLHPLSNTVSVIDLSARRLSSSFTLDESPLRGALNREEDTLYIVSHFSTGLQSIDTRSHRVGKTIFSGGNAVSITVDPKNDLIYIGKKNGEVAIVDPSSGMFIDSFPVNGDAGFMAIDGETNMLLVLSTSRDVVQKFNLVSKSEVSELFTEAGAHALVVMGEL